MVNAVVAAAWREFITWEDAKIDGAVILFATAVITVVMLLAAHGAL